MGNFIRKRSLIDIRSFGYSSAFTKEQLEHYQDCTFFTKKDIMRYKIYKRFCALNPKIIPGSCPEGKPTVVKVPYELMHKMPELKENPLKDQICQVFSEDGQGNLSFDDFLDMFSVLSEMAPLDLKLNYAFRIFDFDKDGRIGRSDLNHLVHSLTREELGEDEVEFIIDRIMDEADLDMSHCLTFPEFEHVVSRSPDFARTFHIRI
ncbi:unnamed protein product [Soboliphyme baturini]|uniref:Calcium and integrin binding family member 2 n=1 Tax=Soboliphyme baturini TaxID=241478 RepID=A0A183IRR9_9BILA|nr:unnamed protein product [Soboliphyme baturini]